MLNYMGIFFNPSIKIVHLKLVNKMEETMEMMEEKLGEWKILTVTRMTLMFLMRLLNLPLNCHPHRC